MREYAQAVIICGVAVLSDDPTWYATLTEAEKAGREYAEVCEKNGIRTILVQRQKPD
jgi:hypothetical protein